MKGLSYAVPWSQQVCGANMVLKESPSTIPGPGFWGLGKFGGSLGAAREAQGWTPIA